MVIVEGTTGHTVITGINVTTDIRPITVISVTTVIHTFMGTNVTTTLTTDMASIGDIPVFGNPTVSENTTGTAGVGGSDMALKTTIAAPLATKDIEDPGSANRATSTKDIETLKRVQA